MSYPYDPWQKCKTVRGLAADEVISALQKEIRRGHAENAATLAYEMLVTSEDMEEYLWYRLKTISVEDVGFGDVFAPVLIGQLDVMRKTYRHAGDRGLLAIHAVRYLCQCKKDRSSDEMYCWIQKSYQAGTLRPQIPDYALDQHTLRGQLAGKGEEDFYLDAAKVVPEWEGRDTTYRERILQLLAESKKEK